MAVNPSAYSGWALAAWLLLSSLPGAVCGAGADPGPSGLRQRLADARFVAYTPRSFAVVDGLPRPATAEGIAEDLRLLRPYFDALVTYSVVAGHEQIPAIAAALGYRALILGVWDPSNSAEVESARRLARAYPALVVAICVGNEGLFWKRYRWEQLRRTMAELRSALPGVAITTAEPFALYLDEPPPGFGAAQDLLLPNVHPVFEPWFRPEGTTQAVDFVAKVVAELQARYAKPVLVKESGMPSGPPGSGFSEDRQAAFWDALAQRLPPTPERAFAYFEAFDAPWKPAASPQIADALRAAEAHWGLLDAGGRPKAALPRGGQVSHSNMGARPAGTGRHLRAQLLPATEPALGKILQRGQRRTAPDSADAPGYASTEK